MNKELELIDVLFDWAKSRGLSDITIKDLKTLEMLLKQVASVITEKIEEILDVLEDMAYQHCWNKQNNKFDSFAISSNASALRLLAKHGRIRIIKEYGDRVIAKPVEKEGK